LDEATKKRLDELAPDEQTARFHESRKKLGLAEPTSISGGRQPTEASLEEYEEYQFLKKLLGYA
jgi:hypothetical protein